jgi:hypothetical protein
VVLAAPILAHLTLESCCPAERIDFWQLLEKNLAWWVHSFSSGENLLVDLISQNVLLE